jgi:hypothetical protein
MLVQRVLRHAKAHVTKDRYIRAFDPAVLAAIKKMETSLDAMKLCAPNKLGPCGRLLKARRGEVAERLNAAVSQFTLTCSHRL